MARFLIENADDEGKVEFSDKAKARRKEIHLKFMEHLPNFNLYNGLTITSLLSRIQSLFEEHRIALEEEIESQDYDDLGTVDLAEIYK